VFPEIGKRGNLHQWSKTYLYIVEFHENLKSRIKYLLELFGNSWDSRGLGVYQCPNSHSNFGHVISLGTDKSYLSHMKARTM
jgi:hypothetical protein